MSFSRNVVCVWLMSSMALMASCSSCGQETLPPPERVPDQVYSGFDFVRDAFSFANFGGGGLATPINPRVMERMFGSEAVCLADVEPCELTPPARLWMDGTNLTLDQGRSEGFAMLSLMFASGALSPEDFGAPTVAELQLSGNVALQEELAYWAATQAVPTNDREDVRHQAADVMPFLADALSPESEKHYRLAIAQRTDTGFARGHALTPLGYFKDNEREDTYWLRVYDNNFPQRERLLELHPEANTWRYEVGGVDGTPIVYESTAERSNFLYFASVESRQGVLPAPFAEGSEFTTQSYSGVTLVASNDEGEETGIRDGEVIEADGDWVSPAFSRCPLCGTAVSIVNQATRNKGLKSKNTVIVTNRSEGNTSTSEGDSGVSIQNYNNGTSSTITSASPQAGDSVTFEDGDVTYSSALNAEGVTISTTQTDSSGATTTVSVTIDGADAGGVDVTVTRNDDGTIDVDVSGLPEGTDVDIETTTKKRGEEATSNDFSYTSNGEDSKASVDPDGSNVTLKTDPADAAICKNGTRDTSESDTDCGGSCGATCVEGKACVKDGDCATGFCEANLCVTRDPMCSSGTQSPGETDVDCGGDTCGACTAIAGDAPKCAVNLDCDNNNCVNGQCRLKYPIFVEFDRLPPVSEVFGTIKLDGVNRPFNVSVTQGTLRYELPEKAYSYQFVNAPLCDSPDTNELIAEPANPGDTAVLRLICPETDQKQLLLRITTGFTNAEDRAHNLTELQANPGKILVFLDDEPGRVVDVNDYFMSLGTYDRTWSAVLMRQPQGTSYKNFGEGFRANLTRKFLDTEVRFLMTQTQTAPTCGDSQHNGDETRADCGGSCAGCAETAYCLDAAGCGAGMTCLDYRCRLAGTCSDGMRNQDEVGVDCGGTCGNGCGEGQACNVTGDCVAGLGCSAGTCQQTCSNGVRDGDETGTDCGGTACTTRCATNQGCGASSDCVSGNVCSGGTCAVASCANGIKDADESGVDCGGTSVCGGCGYAKGCVTDSDCEGSNRCDSVDGTCRFPHCVNGQLDRFFSNAKYHWTETDVDCGGTGCRGCATGQACEQTYNCASGTCENGTCDAGTCDNGSKDANETDVDCGGSDCATRCARGSACVIDSDCTAGDVCSGGACAPPLCENSVKDADESDVDCGGASSCDRCANGSACGQSTDCASGACLGGVCELATCDDSTLNGNETDTDCGGTDCAARCTQGQACGVDMDCASGGACVNNVCAPTTCSNGSKDADESDVDCGGTSACDRCTTGQACTQASDCAMSSPCINNVCASVTCSNSIKDADESDVDCGNASCGPCAAGSTCTEDSDCADSDCACGANSGNCSGDSGTCGAGQFFIDQPVTDGTTASGTYTIPAGCTQLYVQAWGAGGASESDFGMASSQGGGGGYVDGTLTVTPGDTVTVWLGQGGDFLNLSGGTGSYLGASAPGGDGGLGMASDPGGGGGLTSIQIAGTTPYSWSVPAGAGGSFTGGDLTVTLAGTGGAGGYSGETPLDESGGGGAGDPGGLANTAGAYGVLPSGLTAYDGDTFNSAPGGTTNADYARCQGANSIDAGIGNDFSGSGGDACVVLRCVTP